MKVFFLTLTAIFALIGCGGNSGNAPIANDDPLTKDIDRVWVYMQINVPYEGKKLDSYWYYGRITKKLHNKISNNAISSGFFQLRDVHYYSSDDDTVYAYKDDEYAGNLTFRVEHVVRVNELARAPIVGFDEAQFDELTPEKLNKVVEEIDKPESTEVE